jgi:hypothetical protein
VTQGDKLKRVEDFKFRGLPVRCQPPPQSTYGEESKRKVKGKKPKIDANGRKFASKKVKLDGDPKRLKARVEGKVKDNGKAKGELRARFIDGQGGPCDSRLRKWKAS